MRIYIDIDDVICETAASLCELAEREFGKGVPYGSVREFDLQRVFGLTDEEMARFSPLSHKPGVLQSFPVTLGAVEGVRALVAAGHRVDFVTGRPAYSYHATEAYLESVGLGGIPVTYVDKYGRVYPAVEGQPRTVTLAELRSRHYDVAVDDSPSVLPRLAEWTETEVVVFDRPWNTDYPLAANMRRAHGWTDALLLASSRPARRVVVSLGSNLEPREEYLDRAERALSELPDTRHVTSSTTIETEPVDVPDEFASLKFLNRVAVFETRMSPFAFSDAMHEIEAKLGRVRTVRNGPRTVDIDMIDYGGIALEMPELTLPHPRARQRSFVMDPISSLGIDF